MLDLENIQNNNQEKLYFLAGGMNSKKKTISKKAFIYKPDKNRVEKIKSMNEKRYNFPVVFH